MMKTRISSRCPEFRWSSVSDWSPQLRALPLLRVSRCRQFPSSTSSCSSESPSSSSYSSTATSPRSNSNSSSATSTSGSTAFPPSFGANQVLPLTSHIQSRLLTIHNHFKAPIQFSFAYGSGVFDQQTAGPEHSKRPATEDGKKMLDFIMAVNHPQHWHAINLTQNPHHYSTISRWLGSGIIEKVQALGAGIWYLPYVKIGDELVKYGVIDIDILCQDLLDWNTLYVSGRMHKPVAILTTDPRVRLAQQVNLSSALRVAQLLLPSKFTEVELYSRIASLSYVGDFRMSVPGGENADKVRNIVLGQRDEFRRLYAGLVRSMGTMKIEERRKDRYTLEKAEREEEAQQLGLKDLQAAFWLEVVQREDFNDTLLKEIAGIVKSSSTTQSLKGIYTAGFGRTLKYVAAKVGKYFDGKKARQNEGSNSESDEKKIN